MVHNSEIEKNPFSVSTPENLTAREIFNLFVPYPEYENLQSSGHQFLDGHRGSGKSMMLRMMCPDCQLLSHNNIDQLNYFAVYLSIKKTNINNPEYSRLEKEIGGSVLSEHVLTTHLLSNFISSVQKYCTDYIDRNNRNLTLKYITKEKIFDKLKYAGWEKDFNCIDNMSTQEVFNYIVNIIDEIHAYTIRYIRKRAFQAEAIAYKGCLFGFQDILLPIVELFRFNSILPKQVYFLLDDADNLTFEQTQVLNTWVSYRSTDLVSLKISTQLNYKTYNTISGIRIESPHDFSKIEFTSIRTGSKKDKYPELIRKIVEKRLQFYGLSTVDAYSFFPPDEKQKQAILEIAQEYRANWEESGSGYRPDDDAYRYARPEYIRRLSGSNKQGFNYSYSGFEQLIHISSGIIRYFLEPAALMFTEQLSKQGSSELVKFINPSIQNKVLREEADKIILDNFDVLMNEPSSENDINYFNNIKKLRNLILGLGEIFKAHILDEAASQRRLFSFTVSGNTSEIKPILKLGVMHGYFYEDSRGTRDGLGREVKYVLTRRVAPAFNLDPIGFSGDKSLTADLLLKLCLNPKSFTSKLRTHGTQVLDDTTNQLSLLNLGNDIND